MGCTIRHICTINLYLLCMFMFYGITWTCQTQLADIKLIQGSSIWTKNYCSLPLENCWWCVNMSTCECCIEQADQILPLCTYEVVYMVAVLTYAPLILLLRCQSNFLAIRMECAELWNRCVYVRAEGCFLRCTGRPCMWWVRQSKCLHRSLLPAPYVGEQVERWQAGHRAEKE